MSAVAAAALVTFLALGALLAGESLGVRFVSWVAKPVASAGFVAVALLGGALQTPYGTVVLLALVLCWLGDVLLLPRGAQGAFLAGLVSFLLGHLAFVVAFVLGPREPVPAAAAAVAVGVAAAITLRWLGPHVPERMRNPVRAYVAVISLMVVAAASAAVGREDAALALGALLFFVSDLAVARERFVHPSPWNRLWGLPLYYAGTLLLATTVA